MLVGVVVFSLFYYVCSIQSQEDPTIITDIRSDIQEECSKFGTVKKILLFDVRAKTREREKE